LLAQLGKLSVGLVELIAEAGSGNGIHAILTPPRAHHTAQIADQKPVHALAVPPRELDQALKAFEPRGTSGALNQRSPRPCLRVILDPPASRRGSPRASTRAAS
jgi:hypothetical protein